MTTPDQIEHQRLLQELDRLEDEQRTLNLRDEAAWRVHREKVNAIREQIAAFLTQRETRNHDGIPSAQSERDPSTQDGWARPCREGSQRDGSPGRRSRIW
jgi:hypothetical protein